jgi:hypothetical protein
MARRICTGVPDSSESDAEKIRDKDFVFTGYTFKRFHPAEPGRYKQEGWGRGLGPPFLLPPCSLLPAPRLIHLTLPVSGQDMRRTTARKVAQDMSSAGGDAPAAEGSS